MAKRPDLDALIVPKDAPGPAAPPEAAPPARESASKAYAHTLSYRMTPEQYRRLRRYVAEQEEKTGKRLTHQAFIEDAVEEAFKRLGA